MESENSAMNVEQELEFRQDNAMNVDEENADYEKESDQDEDEHDVESEDEFGDGEKAESDEELEDPRKLFIGGLHAKTTEDDLKEHFSAYGTVESCIIAKDQYLINKRGKHNGSKGFGFLTMSSAEEAQAVLKEKHTLQGRLINATIARPINAPERKMRLSVCHLDKEKTTDASLRAYFSKFGTVTSCLISKEEADGKILSRGFGFVAMALQEEVDTILSENTHGRQVIDGAKVEVKQVHVDNSKAKRRQIYIGNLDPDKTTKDDIREYFSQWGEIQELTMPRRGRDAISQMRTYAFVRMSNDADYESIIKDHEGEHDSRIHDRLLDIRRAGTVENDEKLRKFYVGELDKEKTTEADLIEYFTTFGTVVECTLVRETPEAAAQEAAAQEAAAQEAASQEAEGQEAAGQAAPGQEAAGQEAAGQEATGQAAGQEAAGQEAAGQEAAGQEAAGQEAAGQEAAGQEAAGQEAAGQEAAGQEAAGQEAAGQEAAGQAAAGQEAAGQEAAGQEAAGQEAAGQEAAGQEAAGQEAAGQEAAGQEAAGQEAVSKGYAFLLMSKIEEVDAILKHPTPHVLHDKELLVNRASPHTLHRAMITERITKMNVTNFKGTAITVDDLREYFSKYGRIVYVELPANRSTGKQLGFAVIEMASHHDVEKLAIMHEHYIKDHRCVVTKFKRKDAEQRAKQKKKERKKKQDTVRGRGRGFPRGGGWVGGGPPRGGRGFPQWNRGGGRGRGRGGWGRGGGGEWGNFGEYGDGYYQGWESNCGPVRGYPGRGRGYGSHDRWGGGGYEGWDDGYAGDGWRGGYGRGRGRGRAPGWGLGPRGPRHGRGGQRGRPY